MLLPVGAALPKNQHWEDFTLHAHEACGNRDANSSENDDRGADRQRNRIVEKERCRKERKAGYG